MTFWLPGLDRAEALWKELCDDSDFEETALAQLLIIHQQLRDWDNAIAVAVRLQKFQGKKLAEPISHFYCEQAESALRDGDKPAGIAKSSVRSVRTRPVPAPACGWPIWRWRRAGSRMRPRSSCGCSSRYRLCPEAMPKSARMLSPAWSQPGAYPAA